MHLNSEDIAALRWLVLIGGGFGFFLLLWLIAKWRPGWLEQRAVRRFDVFLAGAAALLVGVHATNVWHGRESVIVNDGKVIREII